MVAAVSAPALQPLASGLHPDVSQDRYLARELGVVRKSPILKVERSPRHYHQWATCNADEDEETPALCLGKAVHMALLEPERFGRTYIIEPEWGPCRKTDDCSKEEAKDNKTRRDEFRRAHQGHQLLTGADGEALMGIVKVLTTTPKTARILAGGLPEVTLAWQDKETGLQCRARADLFRRDLKMVVDIKTTLDARREYFRRDIAKYAYGIQDVHYRSGFAELGEDVAYFTFLAVEKEPPYAWRIYTLNRETLTKAYERTRTAMRTMAECMASGRWPGYPEDIEEIDTPPWG